METYGGIFARTSVKGCLPLTRDSLLQFPILSFFQFVTITDNIDVHYYLFDGEHVPEQEELAQMVEHSLSMRELLGSIPRFSSYESSSNSCFT